MKKNVILTGMMGVGKSTVGKYLAEKLYLRHIDIYKIIEKRERTTINNIFKFKGETYFRKVENLVTLNELENKNVVISLGGGAFLNKNLREKIKENGISIWLDVSINKLNSRLSKSKKRPLLNDKNKIENLNKIYLARKKIYEMADYKIKCDSLKTISIVKKIIEIYEKARD